MLIEIAKYFFQVQNLFSVAVPLAVCNFLITSLIQHVLEKLVESPRDGKHKARDLKLVLHVTK